MAPLRRVHERISREAPVRLVIPDEEGGPPRFEAKARVADVSLGGCFVQTTFFLRRGEEVVVLFEQDGAAPLAVPAEVVRVVDRLGERTGMGLAFFDVEVEDGDRERLVRLLVPDLHQRFYGALSEELPELAEQLPLQDVSLLVHLWEEWRAGLRRPT